MGAPFGAHPVLGKVLRPPRARRAPGPAPEGMAEGAELGIAQQEGDLGEAEIGIPEISEGQIMAKLVQDLGEAHPKLAEPPGQSPDAHPELMGDDLRLRFAPGKELGDDPLDPIPQIGRALLPVCQDLLAIAGQKPMEPFIRRGNRQPELAAREGQRIVARAEMNGTAEEPLELRDLVVTGVAEPDLAGAKTGVGQKSEAMNEVCRAELD